MSKFDDLVNETLLAKINKWKKKTNKKSKIRKNGKKSLPNTPDGMPASNVSPALRGSKGNGSPDVADSPMPTSI